MSVLQLLQTLRTVRTWRGSQGVCSSRSSGRCYPPRLRCSRDDTTAECSSGAPAAVEAPTLPPLEQVHTDGTWITGIVAFWLNEEWTPLAVHSDVGNAAGAAYVKARQRGAADMGDLVLSMASELLLFEFGETFVNAFEVSNKVVELIMLRDGVDVCCVSPEGQTLIARYREESSGNPSAP